MPERERVTPLLFSRRNAAAGYSVPTPDEVTGIRSWLEDLNKTQITDPIRLSPEVYNSGMSQLRARLFLEKGKQPTRAEVVATSLKEPMLNYLLGQAAETDLAGDKRKFAARFDAFFGAAMVFDRLLLGIDQSEGKLSDELKADMVTHTAELYDEQGTAISITDSANAYVRLNALASRMGQLFQEDQTGFSIVDDYIADVKQYFPGHSNQAMHSFQVSEFVLAGAEFARKFYQAIYELPERVEKQPMRERQLSKKDEDFYLDLLRDLEANFVSHAMVDPDAERERIDEIYNVLVNLGQEEVISPIYLTVSCVSSDLAQRLQFESDQIVGDSNRTIAAKQFLNNVVKGIRETTAMVGTADGRQRFGIGFGGVDVVTLDGHAERINMSPEELEKMDELLMSDGTGFALLDWRVDKVRGSIAEVRGVRMAANVYKAIYPIAAEYLTDK